MNSCARREGGLCVVEVKVKRIFPGERREDAGDDGDGGLFFLFFFFNGAGRAGASLFFCIPKEVRGSLECESGRKTYGGGRDRGF